MNRDPPFIRNLPGGIPDQGTSHLVPRVAPRIVLEPSELNSYNNNDEAPAGSDLSSSITLHYLINHRKVYLEGQGTVRLGKYLPCQHKDLRPNPQNPCKITSHAKMVNFRPVRNLVLREVDSISGDDT